MVRARARDVDRSDYLAIWAAYEAGECAHDIGVRHGLTADGMRSLISRIKRNPKLLESKS